MSRLIGLDFGTNFVRMAVLEQGKPQPLGDPIVVWRGAGFPQHPGIELQLKQKMHDQKPLMIYGQTFSRVDLTVQLFTYARKQAESILNEGVTGCVVTVPSHAGSLQREAYRRALQKAGFEHIRLMNTPSAVAVHQYDASGGEQKLLVVCLGAGELDVNIAVCSSRSYTVLASGGLDHVSGYQFTARIAAYLLHQFQQQYSVDLTHNAQALALIWDEAQRVKELLSTCEDAEASIPELLVTEDQGKLDLAAAITRKQFEQQIESYVQDAANLCQRFLGDLHLSDDNLNQIMLEGGSCQIPLLKKAFTSFCSKAPTLAPEYAPALGAARYTTMLEHEVARAAAQRRPDAPPSTEESRTSAEIEDVRHLLEESDRLLADGDFSGALHALGLVNLTLQRKRANVHFRQGELEESNGNLIVARQLFVLANKIDRSNSDYREALSRLDRHQARILYADGQKAEQMQDPRKAVDLYRQAIQLDPENVSYREARARLVLPELSKKMFNAIDRTTVDPLRLKAVLNEIAELHSDLPYQKAITRLYEATKLAVEAAEVLKGKRREESQSSISLVRSLKPSEAARANQEERRARAQELIDQALVILPGDLFLLRFKAILTKS